MSTTDKDEFLFGKATKEIDEPVIPNENSNNNLSPKEIDEKDKDRRERRYFSAFKLIVGCLAFLGIIFIVDTVVTIAFGKTSETTDSIIEIVKTLLFTLSGYLFARQEGTK